MTDITSETLKGLLEKATKGRWFSFPSIIDADEHGPEMLEEFRIGWDHGDGCWLATAHIGACAEKEEIAECEANANLISASKTLAQEVLNLREENERLRVALTEIAAFDDNRANGYLAATGILKVRHEDGTELWAEAPAWQRGKGPWKISAPVLQKVGERK